MATYRCIFLSPLQNNANVSVIFVKLGVIAILVKLGVIVIFVKLGVIVIFVKLGDISFSVCRL